MCPFMMMTPRDEKYSYLEIFSYSKFVLLYKYLL